MSNSTDEELLERYFAGEASAFEEFFMRYSGRVKGYAIKKGLSIDEASDIVQISFEKLHRNIHYYKKGEKALPWFFSIVHNSIIDWHRKLQRENKFTKLADTEPSPVETNLDSVEEGLKSLSPEQQTVVNLRMEDLSFKEISTKTGQTEVSLRKTYQRAVMSLKKLIQKEGKK